MDKHQGRYNITLTYQPYERLDNHMSRLEGWIARWQSGDYQIAAWAPTRKKAYMKAYRFAKSAMGEPHKPVNHGGAA